MTFTTNARQGRDLLDSTLFERLVMQVSVENDDIPRDWAERIVDQTAAFIVTAASNPGLNLTPSPVVDRGWHAFLLRTRDYRTFCTRFGSFVDHVPDDLPALADWPTSAERTRTQAGGALRTVEAIANAGFVVDQELWPLSARCTSCHEEGGCRSGGQDGNENSDTRKPPPRP